MSLGSPSQERKHSLRVLIPLLTLVAVSVCGFLLRCLHMLNNDHYYILSPDSYFFHWQAQRVLSHQDIPMSSHSGLTYPLPYAARAISFVFGTPLTEALRWAGVFLPPFLGLVSIVILYLFVSRIYSARIALFSAIAWGAATIPLMVTAAGYLDRDGLTVLLVMIGVFTFYVSRDWSWRVRGLQFGRVAGAVAVLLVEALLYIEWLYLGPLILLAILGAFWATEVMVALGRSLYRLMMRPEADILDGGIDWLRLVPSTFWRSEWRPLALIFGLNAVPVAVAGARGMGPGLTGTYHIVMSISRASLGATASVSELGGLTFGDLLGYSLFGLAAMGGLYIALKDTHRAGPLFVGWFACMFAVGLFVRRVFLFAAPPICVMAGMGLSDLLEFRGLRLSRIGLEDALSSRDVHVVARYATVGLGVIIVVLSLGQSISAAYFVGSNDFAAANHDWQDGMAWLRDNSPQEAVVMSHWDFGYYIRDLSGRRPVVDNGDWDAERNHDIAVVYCATDISEAVRMMEKYQADYVVFSTTEYALLPMMTEETMGESYGDGKSIPPEMSNSLYARALSGKFISDGGLSRVYPEDLNARHLPLVILALDPQ